LTTITYAEQRKIDAISHLTEAIVDLTSIANGVDGSEKFSQKDRVNFKQQAAALCDIRKDIRGY